jgi:subtilisin-like proprotein convertase family protein
MTNYKNRTDLKVQLVSKHELVNVWPRVEQYIDTARQWGFEDHTNAQIKAQVANGNWSLIIVTDPAEEIYGTVTWTLVSYPRDKVAFITYIAGKLMSNTHTNEQFRTILKTVGANRVQGYVRKSMSRYAKNFGFNERAVVVESRL